MATGSVLVSDLSLSQYDTKKPFVLLKANGLYENKGVGYTVFNNTYMQHNPQNFIRKYYNSNGTISSTSSGSYIYEYDHNDRPTKITISPPPGTTPITGFILKYNCN